MLRNDIFVPLFDGVPEQLGKLSNLFLKFDAFVWYLTRKPMSKIFIQS